MKEYWRNLRGIREDADFSQSEVANFLHTTQQVISRYEKGENEMPIRHLIALAQLFQTSTDYILGLTSDNKPYRK